jgi:two-component system chemotaxis sensor kinase CheA
MDMDAARKALVQESRELLADMESALLRMERDGYDEEAIHAVFRAAHTIKGSVGLFGLEHVVRFTHGLETILDEVRSGKLVPDSGMISLFLECGDQLTTLIDGVEENRDQTTQEYALGSALLDRLAALNPKAHKEHKAVVAQRPLEPKVEVIESHPDGVVADTWHLSLQLARDVLRAGMDPLSFLRYLASMGDILVVDLVENSIPLASDMDPEELYLGIEVQFKSDATRKQIEDVFEFVADGSVIRILPPHARIDEYIQLLNSMPDSVERIGEILLKCGALTPKELERVLRMQSDAGEKKEPIGQILVSESIVPSVVVAAALQKQKATRDKATQENRVIKIEAQKLDVLIDLVGELVIANAAARIAATEEGAKRSLEAVASLTTLVEGIRDAALGMRMVPIGEVFQRFPRLVRDLAKELGKTVELGISGAETELDKSMVDRLADPLTHMVRNAMDHGLETESVRVAAGKAPQGTLGFNSYHETGSIVIEVSDDGAGINREKVRKRAIERGIVSSEQELSEREILNLIFEPGFSTAETVTNLSGRGVGMDVVKRSIEALRGEIELESEEGVGTTLRLRMPLTLAIIDGFLVGVGDRSYVVPLDMVVECADRPTGGGYDPRSTGIVNLRGEPLPLVRLRDNFGIKGPSPARENIVVVEYGGRRAGLVVEKLYGEFQTVIKPLSRLFAKVPGVGGSTILGNGEVALILDIPAMVQRIERMQGAAALDLAATTRHEPKEIAHAH